MAISNELSTSNQYIKYKITVVENSTDANNNKSNVTVSVRFYRTNTGYSTYGTGTVDCVINGVNYTQSVTSTQAITNNGIVLFSKTLDIPHNADGTKTLTVKAKITHDRVTSSYSGDFNVALTTLIQSFSSVPTLTLLSKTETTLTYSWNTSEQCSQIKIYCNNTLCNTLLPNATSGTFTISNLTHNTSFNVYGVFTRSSTNKDRNSQITTISTYDYPYINSTPDFTIGNAFTIGIYNPLGRSVSVYILGSDNSQCTYDVTRGTSITGYNNNTCVNNWYNSLPNSTKGTYYVRLVCSELNRDTTILGGFYKIKGDETPIFTAFSVVDGNSNTVNVTGDNSYLVKDKSMIRVNLSSPMTCQKGSSPAYYIVKYGTTTIKITTNSNICVPTSAGNQTITVIAYDSRGLSTTVSKTITVHDYNKPKIYVVADRLNNFDNNTKVHIIGNYDNSVTGNNITLLKYRFYEVGNSGTSWYTLVHNGTNGNIACNDFYVNLDNTKAFVVEVKCSDSFGSVDTNNCTVDCGVAIFMIGSNTKKCYINSKEVATLQSVYPVGSIYLSTISTNPSQLFGFGEWVQIKDRFLLGAGDNYNAGDTGGSSEHTLTVPEMPHHTHGYIAHYGTGASQSAKSTLSWQTNDTNYNTYQTNPAGGGQAFSIMPPYLVVYIWKRVS